MLLFLPVAALLPRCRTRAALSPTAGYGTLQECATIQTQDAIHNVSLTANARKTLTAIRNDKLPIELVSLRKVPHSAASAASQYCTGNAYFGLIT
jgi:hypothetical protein